jgi:hypothetical protein
MGREQTESEKGTEASATTRRAMLLGGAAGLAGLVADSVISAQPASATEGQNVHLGKDNKGATARTGILYTGKAAYATFANPNDPFYRSAGVIGYGRNTGVGGNGDIGVYGNGTDYGVIGNADTGVYGEGDTGTYGNGVTYGVYGESNSGTGVYAKSTSGDALEVVGKVSFSRSGLAAVAANKTSVGVTLAGVTTSSMILATLQNDVGAIAVASAVPHSGSFRINLTAAPSSSVKVPWFVIG